jgi:hypothetical protein
MEDRKTKIKADLLVILAWLIALAFAYLIIMKIKLLN